jgi:hypothetical protein
MWRPQCDAGSTAEWMLLLLMLLLLLMMMMVLIIMTQQQLLLFAFALSSARHLPSIACEINRFDICNHTIACGLSFQRDQRRLRLQDSVTNRRKVTSCDHL